MREYQDMLTAYDLTEKTDGSSTAPCNGKPVPSESSTKTQAWQHMNSLPYSFSEEETTHEPQPFERLYKTVQHVTNEHPSASGSDTKHVSQQSEFMSKNGDRSTVSERTPSKPGVGGRRPSPSPHLDSNFRVYSSPLADDSGELGGGILASLGDSSIFHQAAQIEFHDLITMESHQGTVTSTAPGTLHMLTAEQAPRDEASWSSVPGQSDTEACRDIFSGKSNFAHILSSIPETVDEGGTASSTQRTMLQATAFPALPSIHADPEDSPAKNPTDSPTNKSKTSPPQHKSDANPSEDPYSHVNLNPAMQKAHIASTSTPPCPSQPTTSPSANPFQQSSNNPFQNALFDIESLKNDLEHSQALYGTGPLTAATPQPQPPRSSGPAAPPPVKWEDLSRLGREARDQNPPNGLALDPPKPKPPPPMLSHPPPLRPLSDSAAPYQSHPPPHSSSARHSEDQGAMPKAAAMAKQHGGKWPGAPSSASPALVDAAPVAVAEGFTQAPHEECRVCLHAILSAVAASEESSDVEVTMQPSQRKSALLRRLLCASPPEPPIPEKIAPHLHHIHRAAAMRVDTSDPLHARALELLHLQCTGIAAPSATGLHWETLGFQGMDPATDFRGAGVLSLAHLLSLFVHNQQRARDLFTLSQSPPGFPLALVGINITKWAVDMAREGRLTSAGMHRGSLLDTAEKWYIGAWYEFEHRWKASPPQPHRIGKRLVEIEEYARSHVSTVLGIARQVSLS